MNPKLLVLSEMMRGQAFPIEKSPFNIGRVEHDSIDLTIDDQSLSSKHAAVLTKDEKYYIQDFKSTNGTRLNGTRIAAGKTLPLQGGDIIQLGAIEVLFDIKKETSIELQTGIDLSKTIGSLEEELLTSVSPLNNTKKEWKKAKRIVKYGIIILFLAVVVLVILLFREKS